MEILICNGGRVKGTSRQRRIPGLGLNVLVNMYRGMKKANPTNQLVPDSKIALNRQQALLSPVQLRCKCEYALYMEAAGAVGGLSIFLVRQYHVA